MRSGAGGVWGGQWVTAPLLHSASTTAVMVCGHHEGGHMASVRGGDRARTLKLPYRRVPHPVVPSLVAGIRAAVAGGNSGRVLRLDVPPPYTVGCGPSLWLRRL